MQTASQRIANRIKERARARAKARRSEFFNKAFRVAAIGLAVITAFAFVNLTGYVLAFS